MTPSIASVGSLVLRDVSGNEMVALTPDQAMAWLKSQSGGGVNLTTLGQGAQAFGSLLQARNLQDLKKDAKKARRSLKKARDERDAYLASTATVSGPELKTKQTAVDRAQRRVDATQNELIGTMQDNLYLQFGGQAMQMLGGMNGMQGGGISAGNVALGVGAAALLVALTEDDDEEDADDDL